jgi:Uncharacterized enzyme of phenylacetate metabolism
MHVWEVFRQENEGEPMVHVGSVVAPDRERAMEYARDIYSRRYEAYRLWIVPRKEVIEIKDLDYLQPPIDRTYRMGIAYRVTVEKRRRIKEMFEELAREVQGGA